MISASLHNDIKELLALHLNQTLDTIYLQPLVGGSINQSYELNLPDGQRFFCKINSAAAHPHLFLTEKRGLEILQRTGVIRVPKVILYAVVNGQQVLVLEWIESGRKDETFWKTFGEQLAALHHCTQPEFGLTENNYMGSVPQDNTLKKDWITFFIENRLRPLIGQCLQQKLLLPEDVQSLEKLFLQLPHIFPEAAAPSLLHGDLWSGNFMCHAPAQPVLIDPAVYYGHRSIDLAMTTLFGGIDAAFYEAYHYHFPLPENYRQQWDVCNLYPLLIHLLLFGKSYLGNIRKTLRTYAL